MSKRLEDLLPEVKEATERALEEMGMLNVHAVVTSTFRTTAEQIAYWLQGRASLFVVNLLRKFAGHGPLAPAENTYVITQCDGVNTLSNHQSAKALDVAPADANGNAVYPGKDDPRWKAISEIMKRHGFTWGGDWKSFPDYPHYEML